MANRYSIPSLSNAAGGTGTVKKKKNKTKKTKTKFSEFIDKGGVAGWANRKRKKLKSMSKEDLTLFKNKENKKKTKDKLRIETSKRSNEEIFGKDRVKKMRNAAQKRKDERASMAKMRKRSLNSIEN